MGPYREHVVPGGGGCGIFVREAGDPAGPPVVLVHGFNQCGLAWSRQLDSDLAEDHRLVAVDLRGHGRSGRPADVDTAYSDPQLWADDLQAVIDHLGLSRPVTVGWSYAGVVVLDHLAVHGQDAVAGLVLVDAVSGLGSRASASLLGPDFLRLVPITFSDSVAQSVPAVEEFLRLVPAASSAPVPDEEHYLELGYNLVVPPAVRRAMNTRRVDHDDLLRSLTVPLLVVHGELDRVVLPAASARHVELVPAARRSSYAGVGHAPFREDAVRFNRELREFVGGLAR